MEFLLFDFGATLLFLLAYLAVVNLRRRTPLPVARSREPAPPVAASRFPEVDATIRR